MPKIKHTKEQIDNFIKLVKVEIAKKESEIKMLQGCVDKYKYDYIEEEK